MATVVDGVTADTLTDDEALALGLSSIVHAGQLDPDNYAVNAALSTAGLPQLDKEGRPIISYKQYKEIGNAGGRMDGYAMRVMRPGHRGTWLVQASKYLKWFGLGYEAVGGPPEESHLAGEIRRQVEGELAATVDTDGSDERQATRKIEQFILKHSKSISDEIAKRMGRPTQAKRPVRTAQPIDDSDDEDAVTIFYCKDKYPDCKRFFDTSKGLNFHWSKDHGERPIKRPKEQVTE